MLRASIEIAQLFLFYIWAQQPLARHGPQGKERKCGQSNCCEGIVLLLLQKSAQLYSVGS